MPVEAAHRTASQNLRYPVLDALRFFLAFWVVMGHFGIFPLFAGVDESTLAGRTLIHGWSSIVFGTPAVVGFFVISGFCIHLPFTRNGTFEIGRYYLRRYTRILIPLVGSLFVMRFLAGQRIQFLGQDSILWHSIFWSLLCEEIYYAAYPLLRLFRNRIGWSGLLPLTFILGAYISFRYYSEDWHPYGPFGTALILLPVWLLGCLLAEQVEKFTPSTSGLQIWKWRFLCWGGSWICEMLNFKLKIYYTCTMLFFGILAYFWIKNEIAYGMRKTPWKFLSAAGAWSYSLYLIHVPAAQMFGVLHFPNAGAILNWCALYGFILAVSYLFYISVERPSHDLARKILLVKNSRPGVTSKQACETSAQ
jgi:peptidoglycan/LPS O-acetylase OafA/YrhL